MPIVTRETEVKMPKSQCPSENAHCDLRNPSDNAHSVYIFMYCWAQCPPIHKYIYRMGIVTWVSRVTMGIVTPRGIVTAGVSSLTLTCMHALCISLSQAHTRTRTRALSLSRSHSHVSNSHTHARSLYLSLASTHTHSRARAVSLSLSHYSYSAERDL